MEDFKDKQIVQRVIDNSLSGIQDDPWMAQRVLNMAHETQGTGGIVVKKKLSIGFVLMMAVMLLGVTALAATLLWQDAGEKVAPVESENGYYDTWNTEAKIELIKALYDLGELKDNPDAERVLNSTDMPDTEKNALCDKIMCAYVNGSPDTVTLLSILEKLHGDMSTWSMEDKVWYNNLLNANNMLSAEDTNYVLSETGEFTQEQAVEIGTNAMSAQLDVPKDKLGDATAFYGYINLADEEAAHAQFGAHVWLINTDQYYALVSPSGTVIFVGNHDVSGINQQSRE